MDNLENLRDNLENLRDISDLFLLFVFSSHIHNDILARQVVTVDCQVLAAVAAKRGQKEVDTRWRQTILTLWAAAFATSDLEIQVVRVTSAASQRTRHSGFQTHHDISRLPICIVLITCRRLTLGP